MNKLVTLLFVSCIWSAIGTAEEGLDKQCVPEGKWVSHDGKTIENTALIKKISKSQVVLIGEDHENPEHHRMQLHTMTQIYAYEPNMAIGFESFPRNTQKTLDQWVAGEIGEDEFFKAVGWEEIWRFNKDYYLPMFQFARMNKIPMIALNVDRALVAEVGNKGWDNVPEDKREGVSKPAPASDDYIQVLAEVFSQHMPKHAQDNGEMKTEPFSEADMKEIVENPSFKKFMQGQLVWDRAMAQAIADGLHKQKKSVIVGIMGAGHVMGDYGVAHQLKDLKVNDIASLMPWDGSVACEDLKKEAFDYAFGVKYIEAQELEEKDHPRLGVYLENVDGVTVTRIVTGSVAESMGIQKDDKIIRVAGKPVEKVGDVVETVKATLFGTWLPVVIMREGKELELVAKFPLNN